MKRDEIEPTYTMPPRPLYIEDFEDVEPGRILQLFYWTVNKGDMFIKFHEVKNDRVYCQLLDDRNPDDVRWCPDVDGYIYDFGYAVRGSGAEPVHGKMPTERFLDCP